MSVIFANTGIGYFIFNIFRQNKHFCYLSGSAPEGPVRCTRSKCSSAMRICLSGCCTRCYHPRECCAVRWTVRILLGAVLVRFTWPRTRQSHSPSPCLTATALELLAQPSVQSPTAPPREPQLQPCSLGALEPLARGPLSYPGPNLRQSTLGPRRLNPQQKTFKTESFMGFLTSHQPLTLQKTLKGNEKQRFSGNYWNQKIFK